MKTGILFDLDGTLLNTLEDLLDATNYALDVCGYPPRTLSELRRFVGNGAENQIRRSLPQGAAPEEVQRVLAVYKPYYTAHCQVKTRPYDGIPQALALLQKKSPVAIVSNKPDGAVKELAARFFPGIPAFGEAGLPRKPAPDMVYHALDVLGADRANAAYIGDSEVDVATAKNAGLELIAVSWGFRSRAHLVQSGAVTIVDSVAELREKVR